MEASMSLDFWTVNWYDEFAEIGIYSEVFYYKILW